MKKNEKNRLQPALDEVLDIMPSGLYVLDVRGQITVWNRAMSTLTGYDAAETIGRDASLLRCEQCSGGDPLMTLGQEVLLMRQSEVGRQHEVECHIRTRDGRSVPVLRRARVLYTAAGRPRGLVATVTDLRSRKQLEAEVEAWRGPGIKNDFRGRLAGQSTPMREVFERIDLAAESETTVLISGATGTGKELAAEAIHHLSRRRKGPFVRVNCSALSETLLESELFGHVKGAFTGAIADKMGRFEAAEGGTILLDEIGDISPMIQLKLLRVLQERTIERVGETRSRRIDVRVLAATHRDLRARVREGLFREDFYYRIKVFTIEMPPLTERPGDIPMLVEHFLLRYNKLTGKRIVGIHDEVMTLFMNYCWPGNVRELENAIEHAFVTCRGKRMGLKDLPLELRNPSLRGAECRHRDGLALVPQAPPRWRHEELIDLIERCHGNKAEAARRLGINRTTLWRHLKNT